MAQPPSWDQVPGATASGWFLGSQTGEEGCESSTWPSGREAAMWQKGKSCHYYNYQLILIWGSGGGHLQQVTWVRKELQRWLRYRGDSQNIRHSNTSPNLSISIEIRTVVASQWGWGRECWLERSSKEHPRMMAVLSWWGVGYTGIIQVTKILQNSRTVHLKTICAFFRI